MAKLPSPYLGLLTGMYQGYKGAEQEREQRTEREQQQAYRQAQLDLQRQQEQRIADYQNWQMESGKANQQMQLMQAYQKAVNADLTGLGEDRKRLYHEGVVNRLETQLGRPVTPYQVGMYDKQMSAQQQVAGIAGMTPPGMQVRPEIMAQAYPMMKPGVPSPPPFVNQREQGMAAKMGRQIPQQQFTPPQVQSPYVAAPQQPLDPRAAQVALTQAWQELRQLNQYNPNDPAKASLEARIRWLSDAVGVPVAEGSFAVDPMKVVEGERIRQGDEALDIKRTLAEETIRHHEAVEKIQATNAATAKARAEYDKAYKEAQLGLQGEGSGLRRAEIVANLQNQLGRIAVSKKALEIPADSADAISIGIKSLLRDLGSPMDAPSGGGQSGAATGTQKTQYDASVKEAMNRNLSYEAWRNAASKYVRKDYPGWSQAQRETWMKAKWRANGGK